VERYPSWRHALTGQDNGRFVKSDDSIIRAQRAREMAAYLWLNYIEYVGQ